MDPYNTRLINIPPRHLKDPAYRSLQLIEQHRRFDRFLRGAARGTRHADERFAKATADAEEELRGQVARIAAMETGLAAVQGTKSLEIRVRDTAGRLLRPITRPMFNRIIEAACLYEHCHRRYFALFQGAHMAVANS